MMGRLLESNLRRVGPWLPQVCYVLGLLARLVEFFSKIA
jgi:hypothetical protein